MKQTQTGSVVIVSPKEHARLKRAAVWIRRAWTVGIGILAIALIVAGVHAMPASARALATPTDAIGLWTLVVAVGTVGLAFIALFGLTSLRLTRREMSNRAKRDARAAAILRCEQFAREIIPLNGIVLSAMARDKTQVFAQPGSGGRLSFDAPSKDELKRALDWYNSSPQELRSSGVDLLNKLEAWSMYFTAQLADADLAYEPIGSIFCSMVIQYYAVLLLLRHDPSAGNYTNVVGLYEEWMDRHAKRERLAKEKELVEQVMSLQKGGPAMSRIGKPIGYE